MPNKPIYVRVDDELREGFESSLEITGLEEAQFVKAAIKAFVEYVNEHGEIRLPLAIIPKTMLKDFSGASGSQPGKTRARGEQLTAGPKSLEAAERKSPSSGFPSAQSRQSEDAPREIRPVIPAREKTPPRIARGTAPSKKHAQGHSE